MVRYLLDKPYDDHFMPRYNIAPMQNVWAIIHDGRRNRIGQLRWGLVPAWASNDRLGSKLINARAETLLEKPSFNTLVHRKRAILPTNGFYEWKKDGDQKQPMRITMKDHSIFSLAALYDTWSDPDGQKISTCTIVTTTPNALMTDIHDRMPAILRPEHETLWLDRNNSDTESLVQLLQPYPAEKMRAYPVSQAVGNVRNDTPECIQEIPVPDMLF